MTVVKDDPAWAPPQPVTARRAIPMLAGLYWARARNRVRACRAALRRSRSLLVSVAAVVAGACLAGFGGWLVGRWCLGVVLIAEAAGLIFIGMARDDGVGMPGRGARTVNDILDDERLRP